MRTRLQALLLVAPLLQEGGTAPPASRGPTPEERASDEGVRLHGAVERIEKERAALLRSESPTWEGLRRVVQEQLRPIDFGRLAPEAIRRDLRPYFELLKTERQRELLDTLERRALEESEEGLQCAAVAAELFPRAARPETLIEHPALARLLESGEDGGAPAALMALASLPGERLIPCASRIAALVELIPTDSPPIGSLLCMLAVFEAVPHVGEDPGADPQLLPQRDRMRGRLLSLCRAAARALGSELEENPDNPISRSLRYLAGPASLRTLVGSPAPELRFGWSTGPASPLAGVRELEGKVVVLEFWATWCAPCVACFDPLRELQEVLPDEAVLIGVTSLRATSPVELERDVRRLEEFVREHRMTWTVAVSTDDVFSPDWGVRELPYLVVVDKEGTIRGAGLDLWELGAEGVDRIVRNLLAE